MTAFYCTLQTCSLQSYGTNDNNNTANNYVHLLPSSMALAYAKNSHTIISYRTGQHWIIQQKIGNIQTQTYADVCVNCHCTAVCKPFHWHKINDYKMFLILCLAAKILMTLQQKPLSRTWHLPLTHLLLPVSTLAGHTSGTAPAVQSNERILVHRAPYAWNSQMTLELQKGPSTLEDLAVNFSSCLWKTWALTIRCSSAQHTLAISPMSVMVCINVTTALNSILLHFVNIYTFQVSETLHWLSYITIYMCIGKMCNFIHQYVIANNTHIMHYILCTSLLPFAAKCHCLHTFNTVVHVVQLWRRIITMWLVWRSAYRWYMEVQHPGSSLLNYTLHSSAVQRKWLWQSVHCQT